MPAPRRAFLGTCWRRQVRDPAGRWLPDLAVVPQGRRVWVSLTVAEHLALVARARRRSLPRGAGGWTVDGVLELLPRLGERRRHYAGQLSGGQQQMLAVARALDRKSVV